MFLSPSNAAFFTNSAKGDMLMRTVHATDSILIGIRSNAHAAVTVSPESVVFYTSEMTYSNDTCVAHLYANNSRLETPSLGVRDVVVLRPSPVESAIAASTFNPIVVDGRDLEDASRIYADNRAPEPGEMGGWRFARHGPETRQQELAWYLTVNADASNAAFLAERMDTFYVRLRVKEGLSSMPFVSVLTHPARTVGEDWFATRRVYRAPASEDYAGRDLLLYVGRDPADCGFVNLDAEVRVRLDEDMCARIGDSQGHDETVHLVSLCTDAALAYDFTLMESGHRFGGKIQRLVTYMT
jgi:hypothetical protein